MSSMIKAKFRPSIWAWLLGIVLFGAAVLFLGWSFRYQIQLRILWPVSIWMNQQALAQDVAAWRQSPAAQAAPVPAKGPLRRSEVNPRYLVDPEGNAVYLGGAHTWSTLVDNGGGYPPPAFDYGEFLDFLSMHNHNFFRLWAWESGWGSIETRDPDYRFSPLPYARTGPELALDGQSRYDLGQWNEAYFERLRERVTLAQARGLYVAVMLFDGWSNTKQKGPFVQGNAWPGHPYNVGNNINGVNGDPNGDNSGEETHELGDPELLAYQEAYVRKVVDTVNEFDNVLYEISNESHNGSVAWQEHMIRLIKEYEATLPKQHPVGMTSNYPDGNNQDLFASSADWIAPNGDPEEPFVADGTKVVVADSDHTCPFCVDSDWAWKAFVNGQYLALMDGYDGAAYGAGGAKFDYRQPATVDARRAIGDVRRLAERLDLLAMTPSPERCSTGYCLVQPVAPGAAFVVYAPEAGTFTVDLTGVSGPLQVEWLQPDVGTWLPAAAVQGGAVREFSVPDGKPAVLYLHE